MESKEKNVIVFRKGKRIILSPVEKEDIPTVTRGINDPDVNQFLTIARPMTREMEEEWQANLSKKGDDVIFALRLIETGELIGVMGLHHISHLHGTAGTGSWILKEHQDKGYGTEAKMILLEYAFNTLNLRKINSSVYDFNPRSKRCLEKCGYKEEGMRKAQMWRCGRYADEHMMAVFREDFLPIWEKYKRERLT